MYSVTFVGTVMLSTFTFYEFYLNCLEINFLPNIYFDTTNKTPQYEITYTPTLHEYIQVVTQDHKTSKYAVTYTLTSHHHVQAVTFSHFAVFIAPQCKFKFWVLVNKYHKYIVLRFRVSAIKQTCIPQNFITKEPALNAYIGDVRHHNFITRC